MVVVYPVAEAAAFGPPGYPPTLPGLAHSAHHVQTTVPVEGAPRGSLQGCQRRWTTECTVKSIHGVPPVDPWGSLQSIHVGPSNRPVQSCAENRREKVVGKASQSREPRPTSGRARVTGWVHGRVSGKYNKNGGLLRLDVEFCVQQRHPVQNTVGAQQLADTWAVLGDECQANSVARLRFRLAIGWHLVGRSSLGHGLAVRRTRSCRGRVRGRGGSSL